MGTKPPNCGNSITIKRAPWIMHLQLNHMKLHNYGVLSPLTFNIGVWLNRTSNTMP